MARSEIARINSPGAANADVQKSARAGTKQLRAVPAATDPIYTQFPENGATAVSAKKLPSVPATVQQKVVQRVSEALTAKLLRDHEFDAEGIVELEAWQRKHKFSDADIKKLHDAECLHDAMERWSVKPRPALSAEAMITTLKPPAPVVKPVVDVLRDVGMELVYARMVETNESADKIRTFAATVTDDNRASKLAILMCVASRSNTISGVEALTPYGSRYSLSKIFEWASLHSAAATLSALAATVEHEVNADYMEKWLTHVRSDSKPQLKLLIRFQALHAGGAVLVKKKKDKWYQQNVNERTGFLKYKFNNGEIMEVHTHWNVTEKKIKSMHVQLAGGKNGPEINEWDMFSDVKTEIIAAQNRSNPTTDPVGGTLT